MSTETERRFKQLLDAVNSGTSPKDAVEAIASGPSTSTGSLDVQKQRWEILLKEELFRCIEEEPENSKLIESRLDLALCCSEHELCEPTGCLSILEDVLEAQTITACARTFSWMESHNARLTANVNSSKSQSRKLTLLRTLNTLLRRLSRSGHGSVLRGRVLSFLGLAFPLDERSGVNLRGEYGPAWTGPGLDGTEFGEDAEMEVGKKHDETYRIFWSLQNYFAKPSIFIEPTSFETFKKAVNHILPILREACTKDTASRAKASGEGEATVTTSNETPSAYFFPHYLTAPALFDLQIADMHFRRQVLLQLIVLLRQLISYTPVNKPTWMAPTILKNRQLALNINLTEEDATWLDENEKAILKQIKAEGDSLFGKTVEQILDRETNWIRWKNENCPSFSKAPIDPIPFSTQTGKLSDWQYAVGTKNLSDVWLANSDLPAPVPPPTIDDSLQIVKEADEKIERRKEELKLDLEFDMPNDKKPDGELPANEDVEMSGPAEMTKENGQPAKTQPTISPALAEAMKKDDEVQLQQTNRQRATWLALRDARTTHLSLFSKIGTGDLVRLKELELEQEKPEQEKPGGTLSSAGKQDGESHAGEAASMDRTLVPRSPMVDGPKEQALKEKGDASMAEAA